jgi:hypothetical protein
MRRRRRRRLHHPRARSQVAGIPAAMPPMLTVMMEDQELSTRSVRWAPTASIAALVWGRPVAAAVVAVGRGSTPRRRLLHRRRRARPSHRPPSSCALIRVPMRSTPTATTEGQVQSTRTAVLGWTAQTVAREGVEWVVGAAAAASPLPPSAPTDASTRLTATVTTAAKAPNTLPARLVMIVSIAGRVLARRTRLHLRRRPRRPHLRGTRRPSPTHRLRPRRLRQSPPLAPPRPRLHRHRSPRGGCAPSGAARICSRSRCSRAHQ